MNLVRTNSGTSIHTPECHHLVQRKRSYPVKWTAQPWEWAQGKTVEEIRKVVLQLGYHCCADCKPLGGKAGMSEGQWISFPDDPWNEITHNLWQGGMYYGPHMKPCVPQPEDFDVIISMAGRGRWSEHTRPSDDIEHHVFVIDDGRLGKLEMAFVHEARDLAINAVMSGKKTLVRCQAGLNRSGLAVALALLRLPPFRGACCSSHAIGLIRSKRNKHALHNPHFTEYIQQEAKVSLNDLMERTEKE